MNSNVTNGLTQHWVTVVDPQGREHVEARWLDASALLQVGHAA